MVNINNLKTTRGWAAILESVMCIDACAPASILSYYLDNIDGFSTIFCPLGYELYEAIGHAMREEPEAFEAAVETGMMQSAISTHLGAALDVWENWNSMSPGIYHLMDDPRLSSYISFHNRIYIESLRDVEDEETWYDTVHQLAEMLNVADYKGY